MTISPAGIGLFRCDVIFAGNGTSDPVNPRGAAVTRVSEGLYNVVVPGSGPLSYVGGIADTSNPDLQARVVGHTAARTFQVQISDRRALSTNKRIEARIPADALAADVSTRYVGIAEGAGLVAAARYIPDAALTASDTNYATLTLLAAGGAAAARTTQVTGGSGNWVAGTPVTLTINTAEDDLVAADALALAITKTLAGVAVPAGVLVVDLTQPLGGISGASVSSDPATTDRVFVQLFLGPQNV